MDFKMGFSASFPSNQNFGLYELKIFRVKLVLKQLLVSTTTRLFHPELQGTEQAPGCFAASWHSRCPLLLLWPEWRGGYKELWSASPHPALQAHEHR